MLGTARTTSLERSLLSVTDGFVTRDQPPGPPFPDAEMQDALFASKVDAFAAEYNHLLVSQLDSQRQYFEGLLRRQEHDSQQALFDAQSAASAASSQLQQARDDAREALSSRKNSERKLVGALQLPFCTKLDLVRLHWNIYLGK